MHFVMRYFKFVIQMNIMFMFTIPMPTDFNI